MASRNKQDKTLLELANGECRWWTKDDSRGVATHFCAKPTAANTSWCEEHLLRMSGTAAGRQRIEQMIARKKGRR